MRAIGPGFLVYAIGLALVEEAGFPGWLPGIGVVGMVIGFSKAERGDHVARALRREVGAAADATVVRFKGHLSRVEPWTEPEEPVSGALIKDARGTAVTLAEGSPEGPFAPDRVTETEHGYHLRTPGGLLHLRINRCPALER